MAAVKSDEYVTVLIVTAAIWILLFCAVFMNPKE